MTYTREPELHDPVAVIAFSGWNDAASAATNAARWVARRLGARRFATIEADPFYDFAENRPSVRIDLKGGREIVWPQNEFFYARNPTGPHDIVIAVGIEPNLRWQTFSSAYHEIFQKTGCAMAVSLGALLADVPHSRNVRVTGSAADPETATKLGLTTSKYEGPTGILGTMHDLFRRSGMEAASLWANVPHYITTSQNPPATLALLERLQEMLGMTFDFTELRSASTRFMNEVNTAVSANSDVADYVRRLEDAYDSGQESEPAALPSASELLLDIEELLRRNRDSESQD